MATFNGTPGDDLISGTNEDDIITGIGGADAINGAGGNDDIDGGADNDTIVGGSGDDTLDGGAGVDSVEGGDGSDVFAAPDNAGDTISGGTGSEGDVDTLVTDLADGDALDQSVAMTINTLTMTGATVTGLEQVQVSNANDFIITLGEDAVFAFDGDASADATDFVDDTAALVAASYDGTTHAVTADDVAFDEAEGITIDGVTYVDGDTFDTTNGGSVLVEWDGVDNWELTYSAPTDLGTIALGTTTTDQTLSVQATEAVTGNVIDFSVALDYSFGDDINVNGGDATFTTDVRIEGNDNANTIQDGAGNDTVVGGEGADAITLNDGDNRAWAGATDTGNDTITIVGDGANIVGGGAGDDSIDLVGDGANEAWAGADNDVINIVGIGNNTVGGGEGDDTLNVTGTATGANDVWGGEGDDVIAAAAGSDGNNKFGGGDGADDITVAGDGDNIIFGGADADDDDGADDTITIDGDGNNTIYGGGAAGDTNGNLIEINGAGANTVFNGGTDDVIDVAATATGANVFYGGAGVDDFNFAAGAVGTVIFETGNGSDSVDGVALDGKVKVDLSALGFADADDVLDSMSDAGADTTLFITAGQVITLENVTLAQLQAADPADWLIL